MEEARQAVGVAGRPRYWARLFMPFRPPAGLVLLERSKEDACRIRVWGSYVFLCCYVYLYRIGMEAEATHTFPGDAIDPSHYHPNSTFPPTSP